MNKNHKKINHAEFDMLLRQEFDCTKKPSPELKNRLIVSLESYKTPSRHKRVSLWWLPALSSTLFTLSAITVVSYLFPVSLITELLCAAALLLCFNTWLMTFIGLKLFNLKEAALI